MKRDTGPLTLTHTMGSLKDKYHKMSLLCSQLVSQRLHMTESLLQVTAKEQGAAEAIGDKLANKAVTVMESMAALVDG